MNWQFGSNSKLSLVVSRNHNQDIFRRIVLHPRPYSSENRSLDYAFEFRIFYRFDRFLAMACIWIYLAVVCLMMNDWINYLYLRCLVDYRYCSSFAGPNTMDYWILILDSKSIGNLFSIISFDNWASCLFLKRWRKTWSSKGSS